MEFTDSQIQRYSRHIILSEVGGKGQKKLSQAKVLVIGAGGLGSPAALYLAAAGIGTIGLVDGDVVDLSNLQRQILHSTATIGVPKVESGRRTLSALNPDIAVKTYQEHVTAENIMGILPDYDIILDGTGRSLPASASRFMANITSSRSFSVHGPCAPARMRRRPNHQTSAKPIRYMSPYQRTASGPMEIAIGSKFGWISIAA